VLVNGLAFDRALGLRSTLFTLHVGTDDNPPPPPEANGELQDLPDVAALPISNPPAAAPALPAVPELPGAPLGRRTAAHDEEQSRALLPLVACVMATVLAGGLLAGWTIARRAGLAGGALRLRLR
jgi:hypothetical protein